MAFAAPDPYKQAIRSGVGLSWVVDAYRGGVPVVGATGMAPTGGSVEDDGTRDGRRFLSLSLASSPGLFGLLAPTGTTLKARCVVTYLNGTQQIVPAGVFDIDAENSGEVSGDVQIAAPDKWVRVKRARFLKPQASTRGVNVTAQIATLIRGALGASEPVTITATSTTKVGALVWERDRDKAILDLAKSIGAWVFFDRDGVATVANQPILGPTSNWLLDASTTGVLTSLDRQRSRERTYNIVVVSSSKSDGAVPFAPQYVWDNDPLSPTFAGPGTFGPTPPSATSAGPFGQVPYFYESPLLATAAQAITAGRAILAKTTGLASRVSLGSVPNPAVDALDVIDVIPPLERYDLPRPVERHMVDKVSHPLDLSEQRIEGRSTRTDDYT